VWRSFDRAQGAMVEVGFVAGDGRIGVNGEAFAVDRLYETWAKSLLEIYP
jgi:hypothetical protein